MNTHQGLRGWTSRVNIANKQNKKRLAALCKHKRAVRIFAMRVDLGVKL